RDEGGRGHPTAPESGVNDALRVLKLRLEQPLVSHSVRVSPWDEGHRLAELLRPVQRRHDDRPRLPVRLDGPDVPHELRVLHSVVPGPHPDPVAALDTDELFSV